MFGVMKFVAYLLLLVGMAILAYAYSIAPYKDEALFMERYMALSAGQSSEYWQLRDEMLTPKFQLQDYGGTLLALAIGAFLVSRKGWQKLKSPKSRVALVGLAFATPLLTVGAYVFDLLQAFGRGEYPHWADSMGIPLMGSPLILLVLLVWSGAHLAFLRGAYQPAFLSQAISRQANWWLLVIAVLTALLVVLFAFEGAYWYAIPGVAWLYFYVSLAALRRSSYAVEPDGQPGATQ